jgi:hypothetical protein
MLRFLVGVFVGLVIASAVVAAVVYVAPNAASPGVTRIIKSTPQRPDTASTVPLDEPSQQSE